MDNTDVLVLKQQVAEQGKLLQEVRDSQVKIANALLGSLEHGNIGLIEETRNLRKEMDVNSIAINLNTQQISELLTFRNDVKKVVAAIAIAVPIIFEIIKELGALIWNSLRGQ